MKDSIQNKINRIQEIALTSSAKKSMVDGNVIELNNNDNLSKSIRNAKDAELFFSELRSAIDLAKRNSAKNVLE
jgi:hypothetical protein